ncbi:hypothetical protein NECID01_0148 [Nematocida sp. AWRm77]|nr:hypothetical protein NECID01_0148 [Nematocida sp. AWRm77]
MKTLGFDEKIVSVEPAKDGLLVSLIGGRVYLVRNEEAEEIGNTQSIIKYVCREKDTVYVITEDGVYRIPEDKTVLELVEKKDLSQVSVAAVSNSGQTVALGYEDGLITVTHNGQEHRYTEHEDIIVGMALSSKTLFSASEDGTVTKIRLGKEEIQDVYDIGRMIRYFGKVFGSVTAIDSSGSVYAMERAENDFVKHKKVTAKVTDVYTAQNRVFLAHNKILSELLSHTDACKADFPDLRIDGLFLHGRKVLPYIGSTLWGTWKREKPKTELREFFDDL